MKYVIFLLAFAFIAGCKSAPVPEGATTVPQHRLWGFTKKSDAHLVVLGTNSLGSDCNIRISIDKKPAADVLAAEVAHFGLTIGSHTLSASTSGRCSRRWMHKISVSVKSGDALIIRIEKAGITQAELY